MKKNYFDALIDASHFENKIKNNSFNSFRTILRLNDN